MRKIKDRIAAKIGEEKAQKLIKIMNVARIVKNVICWAIIVVLVFAVITFLLQRVNGSTPSVFGYTLQRVETGSMEPELHVQDVILSREISDKSEIAVDDIVTFQGDSRFENRKVTHRVLFAPYLDSEGEWAIVTKGDANFVDDGAIKLKDVESKMIRKVDFLRDLYSFFFSPWGLIIFIFLMILIFFDEVMNLIHIFSGKYEEREEEESIGQIIERIQREDAEKQKKKNRRPEPSYENVGAGTAEPEVLSENGTAEDADLSEIIDKTEKPEKPEITEE